MCDLNEEHKKEEQNLQLRLEIEGSLNNSNVERRQRRSAYCPVTVWMGFSQRRKNEGGFQREKEERDRDKFRGTKTRKRKK